MTEHTDFSLADAVNEYLRLRQWVDSRVAELEAEHREHLVCRPGCGGCCVNLSVFAVELYSIAGQLAEAGIGEVAFDLRATCGWLEGGLCRIYSARPIICRTHGLPVAIANQADPEHKEVSFCPLNFTRGDPMVYVFGPDNTLDLGELNERLCRINADFIDAARKDGVELPVRIDLARLTEFLDQMK